MRFEVLLTEDAEQDLEDLHAYIAKFDSLKIAWLNTGRAMRRRNGEEK